MVLEINQKEIQEAYQHNINQNKQDIILKIISNTKWKISVDKEWAKANVSGDFGSKEVTIDVEENTTLSEEPRKANVSITYDDADGKTVTRSFVIAQEGLPILPNLSFVDNEGNNINILESTIGESVSLKVRAYAEDFDESKWSYKWKLNGKEFDNNSSVYSFTPQEPIKYEFSVEIYYNDKPTYSQTASLVFYPTPIVPAKLDKKGKTGASGIMIAEMGIPDSQLETDKYMFVFGYDDTAFAPTSSKYYQYGSNLVRDNNVTKWVYTQWDIEGKVVKSLTRRLYEAGEEENTRGAADNSALQNGDIILTPEHIRAHVDVPEPAKIEVLSMNGVVLQSVALSPRQDFDEQLDFKGLQSGMYILRCTIGDYKTEQKFVIK